MPDLKLNPVGLCEKYGVDPNRAMEGINPLRLAEQAEFDRVRPFFNDKRNHRQRALDRVIKDRLPFCSTANSTHEVLTRLVNVVCPYCQQNMTLVNGGGNFVMHTGSYQCDCGAEVSITLPTEGLSVTPPGGD